MTVGASPARAQDSCAGPLGLVLSGGGAKGLAHIGVLRVLDSLGIRPDLVVGTSMGAIVGAMYASGYSGREIDSLTRSLKLSDLFTQYAPRAPEALGDRQPLILWEEGEGGFILQRAAVRESEVNGLVDAAMLRGNLRARGSFDSLAIPFRAVATDLATRNVVVLRGGDLAQAVRASMSLPVVFEPERIDGRYLGDGALVENVPASTARREGARRLIVSDATEHLADSVNLASPLVVAEQLLNFLFTQPTVPLGSEDRLVRPDVDRFRSLNFSRENVASLIDRGYQAARRALDGYRCTGPAAPGAAPRRSRVQLGQVEVHGGRPAERRFVRRQLGLRAGAPADLATIRDGMLALGRNGGFRAVWLHPSGRADSISLSLQVRPASRRLAGVGLAYDNDLGGRMWVGAVDRSLIGGRLEGAAALDLGELRQDLQLGLRTFALTRRSLRPALTVTLNREDVRIFDASGTELRPVRVRELLGFAGLERPLGAHWRVAAGGLLHVWHDPGLGDRTATGGVLRLESLGLPDEGHVRGEAQWTDEYRSVHVDVTGPALRIAPQLSLVPAARYGWGRTLPLQASFALGGYAGFPGLHIGERRGDREAYGSLAAVVPLLGPLEFRLEGVAGQVAAGGRAVPEGRWELGGRAGLSADTPIGPIRVLFGLARGGRNGMFVRLGRWF